MALGSTTSSSSHVGNNSTSTPYTVGFRFDDDAELVVTVSDPTGSQVLVDGVDYTLSGSGEAGTATFVTTQAWDNTVTVTAKRETSLLQPYTPGTPLDTADLENAFDRTIMAVQDTRREADTKLDELDIVNSLTSTATDKPLGAIMGKTLKDTADTLATTVAGKVATASIVNNLTTATTTVPLSAAQGKVLKDAADSHIADTNNPHNVTAAQLSLVIGTDVQAHSAILDATTASFTTAQETKLAGIETAADVTDTANVTAAGALMDSEVASLSGIKTLTVPDSTTISAFGATLTDDADAAAARTTLGLGTIATQTANNVAITGGTVTGLADNTGSGAVIAGTTTGIAGAFTTSSGGKAIVCTPDATGFGIEIDCSSGGTGLYINPASGSTALFIAGADLTIAGDGNCTMGAVLAGSIRQALGVPTYADETAANAALNAGDIYFNTATGTLRAATA